MMRGVAGSLWQGAYLSGGQMLGTEDLYSVLLRRIPLSMDWSSKLPPRTLAKTERKSPPS